MGKKKGRTGKGVEGIERGMCPIRSRILAVPLCRPADECEAWQLCGSFSLAINIYLATHLIKFIHFSFFFFI